MAADYDSRVRPPLTKLANRQGTSFELFRDAPEDAVVCSFFETGVFDPAVHHVEWLEDVRALSRLDPEMNIVRASFRRVGTVEPHVDEPGFNYVWVHRGGGFVFDGEPVDAQPGDVYRFQRDVEHAIVDTGEPYLRSTMIGQIDQEAIEFWDRVFGVECWLRDGRLYDRGGERPIPWLAH